MVSKLDDYLKFNETALNLRSQRQQILASNLANADTPNYQARDINFSQALQGAMSQSSAASAPLEMTRTSTGHIAGKSSAAMSAGGQDSINGTPLLYRPSAQPSVDNNTVDVNVETVQFADNAIRYEAGITAINNELKNITNALQPG